MTNIWQNEANRFSAPITKYLVYRTKKEVFTFYSIAKKKTIKDKFAVQTVLKSGIYWLSRYIKRFKIFQKENSLF